MKILLIFPLCPLPLNSGGQIRVWNIAKHLSAYHELDLLCFIRKDDERKYESELKKVFKNVIFIKRTPLLNVSTLLHSGSAFIEFFTANFGLLFKALFSDRPLISLLYLSNQLRDYVLKADSQSKYDLIYAETFYGISSLKEQLPLLKTPLLLIEQNIESKSYLRQAQQQYNPIVKNLMMIDVKKIEKEEEYFWKFATFIGGLSDPDTAVIKKRSNRKTLLVENGADMEFFSEHLSDPVSNEVLFVGSLKYFQNVDSLRWIVTEIWPRLKKDSLALRIVGRGADAGLKQFIEEHGLHIDENVEDIRTAFQHATLLLAPIRAGGGTKYKIIEAMASKLPIVTTTLGTEGLAVTDGKDLLIGDTVETIVTAVTNLVGTKRLRNEIAENGYNFVKEHYDWRNIVGKFNQELNSLINH